MSLPSPATAANNNTLVWVSETWRNDCKLFPRILLKGVLKEDANRGQMQSIIGNDSELVVIEERGAGCVAKCWTPCDDGRGRAVGKAEAQDAYRRGVAFVVINWIHGRQFQIFVNPQARPQWSENEHERWKIFGAPWDTIATFGALPLPRERSPSPHHRYHHHDHLSSPPPAPAVAAAPAALVTELGAATETARDFEARITRALLDRARDAVRALAQLDLAVCVAAV